MTEREFAIDVVRRLRERGYEALWAGGCVRDEWLGLEPADYDVATNARPGDVQKLFPRTIAIGAAFGVIDVVGPKVDGQFLSVQVATFRSDGTYTDGRRPDTVTFGTAEADAERRDFTVNGLFFDPLENRLIDYVGGQADLQAKLLRAIGNPIDRFTEDKLRVLRAVRMATRFDLSIDPATLEAGRRIAPDIGVVSVERIAEELRKLLAHPRRGRGGQLLTEWGLVEPIFPELKGCFTTAILGALPERAGFTLALASLLLPIGVRESKRVCLRLKLSTDELRQVVWLVEHHGSLNAVPELKASQLYPVLAHPQSVDLISLHLAAGAARQAEECERILRETPRERLDPLPLITGDDLIAIGWKSGPQFKPILDAVRAAQLDCEIQTRDQAMQLAEQLRSTLPAR
ncbi:MAG: CCA tRNA nucleotidyltransferase [Gemmataceae bacterium]